MTEDQLEREILLLCLGHCVRELGGRVEIDVSKLNWDQTISLKPVASGSDTVVIEVSRDPED